MKRKKFKFDTNISKVSNPQNRRKPANINSLSNISNISTACNKKRFFDESSKPYLKDGAELIIPMSAPDKYRYWSGGQSVLDILLELNAPDSVIDHYVGELQQPEMYRRWRKIMEERIAAWPAGGSPAGG